MKNTQVMQPNPASNEITLNVPRRGSNETYLFNTFNALATHRMVIASLDGVTDPRIIPITRECIVCISDDDIRKKLLTAYEHALEYVTTRNDLDPAQKGTLIIEISQNAVAQVFSFLDEFCGISKHNAIIPMCTKPTVGVKDAAMRVINDSDDMPDLNGAVIDHEEDMMVETK